MARVYKRSDIAEDDIFGDIAASAEKAVKAVEAADARIIKLTEHYKQLGSAAKLDTVEGIEQFTKANEGLNKLTKDTVQLEKEKIKLQQLQTKLQSEEVKAMQQQTRIQAQKAKTLKTLTVEQALLNERQRQANEISRAVAKFRSAEAGSLQQLEAKMKLVELALNRLTPEQIENTKQGQRYLASLTAIRGELMKQQAAYGKHTLNVGNYKSAFDGLGMSVSQLAREMPAFAMNMQTGFMAISNNLPMFFDELQKIKQANKELAASGQQPVSVLKQLAGAIMSPMMALNAFVLLLTVMGPKLIDWASGLFGAEKKTNDYAKAQKYANEQHKKSAEFIARESSEMVGNLMKLAATNKGSKERAKLIGEINAKYGTHLKNLQDEATFQKQINQEVENYLEYQRLRFKLQQYDEAIQRNLDKQQKIKQDIAKQEKNILFYREEQQKLIGADAAYGEGWAGVNTNLKNAEQTLADLNKQIDDANARLRYYGYTTGETEKKIEDFGYKTDKTAEKQDKLNKKYMDGAEAIKEVMDSLQEYNNTVDEMALSEGEKVINQEIANQIDNIRTSGTYTLALLNDLLDAQMALKNAVIERQYQEELAAAKNGGEVAAAELRRQERRLEVEDWAAEKRIEINEKTWQALEEREREHRERMAKEEEEARKKQEELDRKADEAAKKRKEFQDSMVEETLQEMKRISEEQEKMIDQQIANSQKMVDALQAQANAGNIQASQSIAAEKKIIAEQMQAKKQAQKEQQALEELKLLYTATENYVEKGDTVAVAAGKALLQVKGVKVLAKSLMGFFKGTKRTVGEELGAPVLPGRDGHIIRVDGAEKILNPEQSRLTGGATTDEIVNGYLMAKAMSVQPKRQGIKLQESTDALLLKKLDDLQQTIANKPELTMEFQRFSETLFEFAYKEKTGNNLVVNRFQYRK